MNALKVKRLEVNDKITNPQALCSTSYVKNFYVKDGSKLENYFQLVLIFLTKIFKFYLIS